MRLVLLVYPNEVGNQKETVSSAAQWQAALIHVCIQCLYWLQKRLSGLCPFVPPMSSLRTKL